MGPGVRRLDASNAPRRISRTARTVRRTFLQGVVPFQSESPAGEKNYASRDSLFLLACILTVAAALDLLFLGARSLWLDETVRIALARLDWKALGQAVSLHEANMALYYGLLHVWLGLGDSEFVIRSLSALMATGAVGAIYLLGHRMFGPRVGLLGALLLALNAYHIRYAQEASSYSLVTLLVILASLAFVHAIERPTSRNWTLYTLMSVLAVYAHFFAVLVLAAHWLSLALLDRRRVSWKRLTASVAIISMLLAPLGFFAATRDTGQVSWIPKPNLYAVFNLFYQLTGADPAGFFDLTGYDPAEGTPLLAVYVVACIVALVAAVKQFTREPFSLRAWRLFFLLTWFSVPIALALGVSTVKPIFVPYYLIVCMPPLVLLASAGVSGIPGRPAMILAAVIVIATAAYEDISYYRNLDGEDWKGAIAHVLSQSRSGDALVFDPSYLQTPYDYYHARLSMASGPPIASPHWSWSQIARGEPVESHPSDESLKDLPPHYSRIWLISRYEPVSPGVLAFLANSYQDKKNWKFHGVRVALYSAAPPELQRR